MPKPVKIVLLSAFLTVLLTASSGIQAELVGDLNEDYKVDLKDLHIFSLQWLDPMCLAPGCIADLDNVDGVNMDDFAMLANNWKMVESHLVISEFMARNSITLMDKDNESSDWIEIYNPTDTTANLDGWSLTDNDSDLTMWQFPDGLDIKPGEFLLVFASGKDISDPNELHTNFELDQDGDYLALVANEGNTIVHEYTPEYPAQLADISYGLAQYATILVPSGATASYHVPTSGDAGLGTDWTEVNFNDSFWDTGPTSIGFGDVGGSTGTILREYWTGIDGPSVTDLTNNSNYPDNPSGTSEPTLFEAPLDWANDYGTRMHGFIQPPTSGDYTFWISSDDASELWLSSDDNPSNVVLIAYETQWSGSRVWETGPEQSAPITLVGGRRYYIKALHKEDGGGDNLAVTWEGPGIVMGEPIDGQYLSPWTGSYVSTDVHGDMMGINTSLWVRIAFNLEEGENGLFDTMTLRIKYEDGFVAYLNGQEVARRRAPSSIQWNSAADSNRPIIDSSTFEEINLMAYLYLLRPGKNVLAFHGLNDNQDNGDFLILPELVAARNQAVPQYFTTATPRTFNIPGAIGRVGEVWFSHKRGFYQNPFQLNLYTGSKDAQIRYTLDGSEPTITHGNIYSSPIYINKTTIVRAVAVKPGWLDSAVETHTFIFLNDVINQTSNPPGFPATWGGTAADYEMDPEIVNAHLGTITDDLKSIPTMSLVTHVDDMFGPSGIYSNPSGTGFTWERPGSIELIYPSGLEGFQVDCGVRMYGGAFRTNWGLTRKKTFRLLFKGIYGPTKLRYPLFGEDAADEFDTIILRGGANDAWNNWGDADTQYIVDEFMRRTQLALGYPSAHGTFVHLYVNGLYWGLYNPTERPQSSFAANYFGGTKEEWDTNNSGSPCGESSMTTWNAMFNLIGQGMAGTENYQKIQGNNPDGTNNPDYDDLLDMDNYIGYMFSNFWGGTGDWPGHNYYAGCRRPPNATGFKFFNWDSEGAIVIWSSLTANRTGVNNGAGTPYAALRQNSEFCLLFADHAHRYMLNNGPATPGPSYARYKELADEVERAIVAESARWGDMAVSTPYTLSHWQNTRDYVLNTYMPQRRDIVFGQLRDALLYPPDTDAPVFYVNGSPQHGGEISSSDLLTMDEPNSSGIKIYYSTDGNDVRLPEELHITGTTLVVEDAPKKVLVPGGPVNDNWKGGGAFDDSTWNDGTFIAGKTGGVGYEEGTGYDPYISYDVTAKMYNGNTSCYIRIPFTFNGDPCDFNFMMLYIRYDDGFIAHLNGDEIKRINFNETDTPAWNSNASGGHEASALEAIPVSGHIGSLKNGDNILAIQGLNISNTSSDFIISAELVAGEANSTGGITSSATEYTGTPLTFEKSTHVKARVLDGITWSALNEAVYAIGPVAENLRITEIMYNPKNTGDPNDPNTEFIELKNVGPVTLNLNLVKFTEGINFTFPDIELEPNEFVVVVKDMNAFQDKYGTSVKIAGRYTGSLANNGERIKLVDAIDRTILDFEYKDDWYPIADGDGFSLTMIDPRDSTIYGSEKGLFAHWKFDDGSGDTAIDSVGSNNGTLFGGPTWTTGRFDGALSFDGTDDYVSVAPITPLIGNTVTVQTWIRTSEFAGIWNPVLTQSIGNGYYLYIASSKPSFYIVVGAAYVQAISPETINADQWYHVAGTNDGSRLKIYVDGQLKGSDNSTNFLGVNANAYIGFEPSSSLYYYGLIDDVRIYNRTVSESEFQEITNPMVRWSRKSSWRPSVYRNGSPGADDSGILPNPGSIVINEVMAHSNAGPDWIELHNTTSIPINIGGWFLSDNNRDEPNLTKYKIADGTTILGNDYLVFYQDTDFNNPGDSGCIVPFALSENGEEACLSSHLDTHGYLTGYRHVEDFGASQTNISLGRHYKSSTDNFNFVAMDYNTPDANNSYPKVGPVVINEIMYNPPSGNQDEEYIELHNITGALVTLYRYDKLTPWKFTDGIDYTFSAGPVVTIPAYGYLLLVKDLADFTARYGGMPPGVQVLDGYVGRLSNAGERLQIAMPGDIDNLGIRHYIRIDRVTYSDGRHPEDCPGGVDLWPIEADGRGKSLSRKVSTDYGNDVANWKAATPSPGTANP
ncbi:MAG: hypothetical protein GWN67_24355 [Phycisphaerae bacterium]|nr:hypothetical protein [Phycisphaerae bacterium]NIR66850.1 hypothetical protein [candidate division Zixibacteria bacterium]NIP51268.1 hypothetical protein [Phycisphaerae bacterium]NIS54005.1 hypothetical protein [Phycisphaerae bacterium]NIU11613.1 hypothetical protein [Phycisphaerae bacterium]